MNKLYGILMAGVDDASIPSFYKKLYNPVDIPDVGLKLLGSIAANVPDARRALWACSVCYLSRFTAYWKEISRLDPVTTYFCPGKDPSISFADSNGSLAGLVKGAKYYADAVFRLDQDIKDRLVVPLWHDVMAACGLQLLRWAD